MLCFIYFSNLQRRQPAGNKAVVKYLGEYDPEGQLIIEDPYYVSKVVPL